MISYLMLMMFLLPLLYFTFTSSKKLILFVVFIGGIPLTTFMPDLVLLGFLGGLAPQAAFLFFIVGSLSFVLLFSNGVVLREILRFKMYALFIVYVVMSLMWSENFVYGLRLSIKLLSPFLLYMGVVGFIKNNNDFKKVELALYACVLVVLVLIAVNYMSGGAIGGDKVRYKWIPLGVLTAPYMSPANFSFFISSIAIYSIGRYLFSKENKYLAIYFLLTAIVFAAFTRISMAGLVLGTGICVFFMVQNTVVKIAFPLVIVAGFVTMLFTVDKFRDRMFYNADEFNISEAIESPDKFEKNFDTSGRIFLWAEVLEHYKESNHIIGGGVGSLDYLMDREFRSLELHSEFLRLYLDFGIVGLSLYLLGILQIILKMKNLKNSGPQRMYAAIAAGGLGLYLVTLFTDNSLNYVTEFGNYVYAFIGLAIAATFNTKPININKEVTNKKGVSDMFQSVKLR